MSTLSTDRKPLVDYGVQIRFIKDLHDTGGGFPDKSRGNNGLTPPTNKYGVAVRVQGISGHPYVVLKDGEKGDSYGVQLNTSTPSSGPPSPSPSSSSPSPSPSNGLPKINKQPAEVTNPYSPAVKTARSPVSAAEDEDGEIFRSPLRRPPGDGQAGIQVEEEEDGPETPADGSKAEPQVKAASSEAEEEYNEAGLKPVNLNGVGPRRVKQTGPGFSGSLGRHSEKKQMKKIPAVSAPPKSANAEPVPAIDTNSLAPINKLISKFNSGTPGGAPQSRGRSGARQRLAFEERKRSRSLDARKDVKAVVSPPSPSSPTLNPYALPPATSYTLLTSSASLSSSIGRNLASISKAPGLKAPKPNLQLPGKFVVKDFAPDLNKKPEIQPRNQSQSKGAINGEEAQIKQSIFNILKDGSSESEGSLRRKTSLIYEKTTAFKGGSDAELKKGKLMDLQEQLSRCKRELQEAHDELTLERMSREVAESHLRLQEDQLAEFQEELRRVSEDSSHSDSLQTDVMTLQADLAEATMMHQRQEETLRQRERELTALKGALKEEVECHDREMEALREHYGQDMDNLKRTIDQVTQSQDQIEEERERVNTSILGLEEELESCRDRGEQWKMQLEDVTQELHSSNQELIKSRLAKDDYEKKLRDLQDSLRATKTKSPVSDSAAEELRRCRDDLKRAHADLDKQKSEFSEKREALEALRSASREKEAELLSELSRVKEQSTKDKAELEKALEEAKESSAGSAEVTAVDHGTNQEIHEANNRLREKLSRMAKTHSGAAQSPEAEETMEALEDANHSLKSQLEEAKRGAARLSKENEELTQRLEERDQERESLRSGKIDLEEQKRLLDRALEKITKEMEAMMGDSRHSVTNLQTQLDDYRERSRKEVQEAQRSSMEKLADLQRVQSIQKAQQDEVSRLKKELLVCSEERDSAQLERDLLSNRFKHLESELEAEKSTHTDRHRGVRGLEDRIKTLEIELDEERSSVELLNERITRSRDQVDLLRSELMQERSARHDLEMDKSSLERQLKELKSRVADMEGQSRPSAGVALLENKLQELEGRLRSEEREKSSIQASQRRMERKLKELNATLDLERSQHVEQRDQLSLRVKALKRQLDESEGEVERLESVRRKVLRDLEEQQELQEALQAKATALETELKRKSQLTHRAAPSSSALSSEDEDGFYGGDIASMLSDSRLQNSTC